MNRTQARAEGDRIRCMGVRGKSEDIRSRLMLGNFHLARHLTHLTPRKPINELISSKALAGLEIEMSQFIDLCIFPGCDYIEPIKAKSLL